MKKSILSTTVLLSSIPAFAEEAAKAAEAAAPAVKAAATTGSGIVAISAALAVTVAALGGTLGQGRIGAAAMDGIARNPQAQKNMFVPMILGLVFIESLVIFSWLIASTIIEKGL